MPKPKKPGAPEVLEIHLKELGLGFYREHQFHQDRKWRFDFLLKDSKVAIEIEGGVWSGGRHTRGQGFLDDMDKYNTAALCGYRVLRFSTQQVETGYTKSYLSEYLLPILQGKSI